MFCGVTENIFGNTKFKKYNPIQKSKTVGETDWTIDFRFPFSQIIYACTIFPSSSEKNIIENLSVNLQDSTTWLLTTLLECCTKWFLLMWLLKPKYVLKHNPQFKRKHRKFGWSSLRCWYWCFAHPSTVANDVRHKLHETTLMYLAQFSLIWLPDTDTMWNFD